MSAADTEAANTILRLLAEEVADCLAPKVAEIIGERHDDRSPWLTTREAVEYSRLPEGTFRKLAASGKIPSHGGRAKLFYRPEVDEALLDLQGLADEERQLRSVR